MRYSNIRASICALIIMVCLFACSKDNQQSLAGAVNPSPLCDTTNMQYATNILPILQAYCYSCHGNGSTAGSGGISLDGYVNLQKWAANGILVGNITHASGFVAMPVGAPKLSDCDINKIIDWVNHGIQNN